MLCSGLLQAVCQHPEGACLLALPAPQGVAIDRKASFPGGHGQTTLTRTDGAVCAWAMAQPSSN